MGPTAAPRVVTLAADIEAGFKKAGVLEMYRALSYSRQRELALAIDDAKRPETRRRRIDKAVVEIRAQGARPK